MTEEQRRKMVATVIPFLAFAVLGLAVAVLTRDSMVMFFVFPYGSLAIIRSLPVLGNLAGLVLISLVQYGLYGVLVALAKMYNRRSLAMLGIVALHALGVWGILLTRQ